MLFGTVSLGFVFFGFVGVGVNIFAVHSIVGVTVAVAFGSLKDLSIPFFIFVGENNFLNSPLICLWVSFSSTYFHARLLGIC